MPHRLVSWRSPRLERDDDRIDLRSQTLFGYADRLYGSHARTDEVIRKVGGAGEVIGNATEQ